ncbi:hypothetical protein [Vibrio nigripulchritudo]|uniref:hypothetical protein n=1 Tax=Vibrio nigripulchritudo TaxID=28173 RepID=UPI0003B21603|nr:hypothetical protein [Vibrio nigripulchritudo]CCN68599.1 conserved exported hypothetical protein [Vibrio nigripulchritudo SFn118]
MKKSSVLVASGFLMAFLSGCGGGSSSENPGSLASPNIKGDPSLDKISSYQSSTLSNDMLECVKLYKKRESCSLDKIRPIGVEKLGDISLSDIQSRLVVSHSWMADSFINALKNINDQDFLNLFKPLNAIVLSYDVRPSFYHTYTASIYIDPRYLWRNKAEWDSIYSQDDFRSGFSSDFTYDSANRFIYPGSKQYVTYSNTFNSMNNAWRESHHIAPGLFRLLSHELAHANDYLPPAYLPQVGDNGTILSAMRDNGNKIHAELQSAHPLTSSLLLEAAEIAFHGKSITDRVRNSTGQIAGSEFKPDGAADFYGYSTNREDVATLFESYMMYKKYGAISDVAFISIPKTKEYTCNDWKVLWGERHRLADDNVRIKTIFVAQRLLGKSESEIVANMPSTGVEVSTLTSGLGWCESRTNSSSSSFMGVSKSSASEHPYDYLDDIGRKH